jgi:hypothetical protein
LALSESFPVLTFPKVRVFVHTFWFSVHAADTSFSAVLHHPYRVSAALAPALPHLTLSLVMMLVHTEELLVLFVTLHARLATIRSHPGCVPLALPGRGPLITFCVVLVCVFTFWFIVAATPASFPAVWDHVTWVLRTVTHVCEIFTFSIISK